MTTAEKTAVMSFEFPADAAHPLILLDLTDLWQSRQNASVSVDPETGRLTGNGTFLPSFGAGSYMLHYCVDFFGATVFDSGVWVNNRAGHGAEGAVRHERFNLFFLEAGGFVRFADLQDEKVTARVGMSFKSAAQACRNAEEEVPNPWMGLDSLREAAEASWRRS